MGSPASGATARAHRIGSTFPQATTSGRRSGMVMWCSRPQVMGRSCDVDHGGPLAPPPPSGGTVTLTSAGAILSPNGRAALRPHRRDGGIGARDTNARDPRRTAHEVLRCGPSGEARRVRGKERRASDRRASNGRRSLRTHPNASNPSGWRSSRPSAWRGRWRLHHRGSTQVLG